MLRVVDVGDGKAATRLNVAGPEVPGRVGTISGRSRSAERER
jgi:hypothetical protein